MVRWRTAAAALGPCEPPFLIEHADEGAEWGDEARAERAAFRHPGGGRVRLTRLTLSCTNPGATAAACRNDGRAGGSTLRRCGSRPAWAAGRPLLGPCRWVADGPTWSGTDGRQRQTRWQWGSGGDAPASGRRPHGRVRRVGLRHRWPAATQRGVPDQPGDPSRVGPAVVIGGAADAADTPGARGSIGRTTARSAFRSSRTRTDRAAAAPTSKGSPAWAGRRAGRSTTSAAAP